MTGYQPNYEILEKLQNDINRSLPYKFRKEKIMNKAFALLGESSALKLWNLVAKGDPMEFYKVNKIGLT